MLAGKKSGRKSKHKYIELSRVSKQGKFDHVSRQLQLHQPANGSKGNMNSLYFQMSQMTSVHAVSRLILPGCRLCSFCSFHVSPTPARSLILYSTDSPLQIRDPRYYLHHVSHILLPHATLKKVVSGQRYPPCEYPGPMQLKARPTPKRCAAFPLELPSPSSRPDISY
jgi:hypothetical protein